MIEKQIAFNFSGRYYSIGGNDNGPDLSEIWFVLHGQGQLAKYFLEKFRHVANNERKIIAPEGLSKYYLQGFSGRVGSSWMTKENRLTDISNYLNFLNSIYQKEISENRNCKITILGFSQGAATASRWVLADGIRTDRLILWAGLFPPDLDLTRGQKKMNNIDIWNVYGEKDEYLNDKRIAEQFEMANKLGVTCSSIVFEGGHELHQDTLLSFT